MYVYFDNNGVLKEIITERPFRAGDSQRDKIYIYWEGEHTPTAGWVKYRKADGTFTTETSIILTQVNKTLPTDPLQNLKYFSYEHTYTDGGVVKVGYPFYQLTVPSEVLTSAVSGDLIPTSNNMCVANVRFVFSDSSIDNLGVIVFSVETSIGILTDNSISETQYNYIIAEISKKFGIDNLRSVKVDELPEIGETGTIYYIKIENEELYNAYYWNSLTNAFVFMGTTSYGLYTEEEGKAFEESINEEINDFKDEVNGEIDDFENEVDGRLDNQDSQIQSLGQLQPSGTDTSTNILAKTSADGIWVGTDTGHWYYWNGTQYADGGVYQTDLSYNDVIKNIDEISNLLDSRFLNFELGSFSANNNEIDVDVSSSQRIRSNVFTIDKPSVVIANINIPNFTYAIRSQASDGTMTTPSLTNDKSKFIADTTKKYRILVGTNPNTNMSSYVNSVKIQVIAIDSLFDYINKYKTYYNENYYKISDLTFQLGALQTNGTITASTTRIYSDLFFAPKGSKFSVQDGYTYYVSKYYDSIGELHQELEGPITTEYTMTTNAYIRLGVRFTNEKTIDDVNLIANALKFIVKKELPIEKEIVELERGSYNSTTGKRFTGSYVNAYVSRRFHKLADVSNVSKVKVIANIPDVQSDDGIRITQLAADYTLISNKLYHVDEISVAIRENTKYLKVSVFNVSEYNTTGEDATSYFKNISVEFTHYKDNENVKWVNDLDEGDDNLTFFDVGDYITSGRIKLPPNYDINGAKTPLIIFVQGSGNYMQIESGMTSHYQAYYDYLAKEGFAVLSIYGWTTKYSSIITTSTSNPWVLPISIDAYKSAFEYYTSKFNLDVNNVFLMCKSLGGQMAHYLSMKKYFNVNCACLLAPSLSIYDIGNLGYNKRTREIMAQELELIGDVENVFAIDDFSIRTVSGMAFMNLNANKMIMYSPNFINVVGETMANNVSSALYENRNANLSKYCPTPTKIWIAEDDEAVPYNSASTIISQMLNAGSECELRTMPNNTGGHHAVDTDENALKEDITTSLGYECDDIPVAYIEAVQYMNKYKK